MSRRVLTIGAYGFEPEEFFRALEAAGVDVFLDIRQRRGLRGSRYAFANVSRLRAELELDAKGGGHAGQSSAHITGACERFLSPRI